MGEEIENACEGFTATDKVFFNDSNISMFPNPMSDFAKITNTDLNNFMTEINLYNATGKSVRQYSNLKTNELILDKGHLPSGVYYLKILTTENRWSSKKLIIF